MTIIHREINDARHHYTFPKFQNKKDATKFIMTHLHVFHTILSSLHYHTPVLSSSCLIPIIMSITVNRLSSQLVFFFFFFKKVFIFRVP